MKNKFCWLAKQYKRGWRLGLCIGNKKTEYVNVWLSCEKDIKKVVSGNIVFIHIKEK